MTNVLSLKHRLLAPEVVQTSAMDCGPAALKCLLEGFGIPVLEALWSKIPVITSNVSCLPEAGGEGALYIDPMNTGQMADAMLRIATDEDLRNNLIAKGWQHAQHFTAQECAAGVMNIYKRLT